MRHTEELVGRRVINRSREDLFKRLDKIDTLITVLFILTLLAFALFGHLLIRTRAIEKDITTDPRIELCGADMECWREAQELARKFGL